MKTHTPTAVLPLLLALGGCNLGAERASEYTRALPDDRVLIDMVTDGARRSSAGDRSEMAGFTARITGDVNDLIGTVLSTIEVVTTFPPTWTDGEQTALWGPWEDDGLHYALWITHDEAEGLYSWGINLKPVDASDDAYATIIAGQTGDDATETAYAGWFVVDFDALGAVRPDEPTRGLFASTFDVQGDTVSAEAAFEDFRDASTGTGEGTDALYRYTQTIGDVGQLDLVYAEDVTGGATPEQHFVRSRWAASGAGRADAYLTGGDLGELVFTATECWDEGQLVSFYEDNYALSRSGDEDACPFREPSFNEEDAAVSR